MGPISLIVIYIRLERLARDKNSSLLGPFLSCKENEVMKILVIWFPYSSNNPKTYLVSVIIYTSSLEADFALNLCVFENIFIGIFF